MVTRSFIFTLCFHVVCMHSIWAQENIEKLYLGRGIKDFVGKNYDGAITNLNQVLVANPNNKKAQKLLVKCYAKKGHISLANKISSDAKKYYQQALKYNPNYADAVQGLEQVSALEAQEALQQQMAKTTKEAQAQSQNVVPDARNIRPQTYTVPQPAPTAAAPSIIFATPPAKAMDTAQVQIIEGLFANLQNQQRFMESQMSSSNKILSQSESNKEIYINTLVKETQRNNEIMRNIIFIGGGVGIGVILLTLTIFAFIFKTVTKSSDLRTIQANEAVMALLSAPKTQNSTDEPLMIAGPDIPQAYDTITQRPKNKTGPNKASVQHQEKQDTSIESLNTEDPVKRANAVEAIAADIIDDAKDSHRKKIKKIEELLHDENNRVRANAAKAMYEIDPRLSIQTLQDMLINPSKRMRASAVWALGEIGTEEALQCILSVQDEDDEIVRYNIKIALGKVQSMQRFHLSEQQSEQIDTILERFKDMV